MRKVRGAKAKKYAKQFLSLVSLDQVPEIVAKLETMATVMQKEKQFRNMLTSPSFSDEERAGVISYLCEKLSLPEEAKKFLTFLSFEGVLVGLGEIVRYINLLYLEAKKKVKGVVTSAVELPDSIKEKIVEVLKSITGKDVELQYEVDPSLIGGISVKIGSTMYDLSIKGQLGLLRDKLIKG
ncbi:F-type H+-transporting ATPase subunit delta [Thermodesulfovibrio aggregans]|uniref:ATP synthase subunit delta n=1 Tax=Thermodesulfovibrio aggregans TaxID=86166 RepID=A0A0U9HQL9_9BACT|nr:ATP synthase F1 subunit delta [Thermodesulfovibrio aggregans]GAQ95326.1 F-type H+-transporting ATPase subunit delta [Thermodesulfovibrio aggregans]